MTIRCDKCGAVLTPEEPLDPEVITVRIRGCIEPVYTYENEIGAVVEVIDNGPIWWRRIVDGEFIDSILKKDTEPIPDYDKTTHRLRRKWGKYEEFIGEGDLASTSDGSWVATTHNPGAKQESLCIYITPITLKPATPDPSADCLPSIQEVKYLIGSIKQALQAFPGDSMFDETAVGLRYGTIRDLLAIMLNDAEGMGRSWEMKKESE